MMMWLREKSFAMSIPYRSQFFVRRGAGFGAFGGFAGGAFGRSGSSVLLRRIGGAGSILDGLRSIVRTRHLGQFDEHTLGLGQCHVLFRGGTNGTSAFKMLEQVSIGVKHRAGGDHRVVALTRTLDRR